MTTWEGWHSAGPISGTATRRPSRSTPTRRLAPRLHHVLERPSPVLSDTLSPPSGERVRVRGSIHEHQRRSFRSGFRARSHSLPDGTEVLARQRGHGSVSRFQQPGLQLRRNLKRLLLLVADETKNVVDQLVSVGADTGAHPILKEILNVSRQLDCHGGKLSPVRLVCKLPFPDGPFEDRRRLRC